MRILPVEGAIFYRSWIQRTYYDRKTRITSNLLIAKDGGCGLFTLPAYRSLYLTPIKKHDNFYSRCKWSMWKSSSMTIILMIVPRLCIDCAALRTKSPFPMNFPLWNIYPTYHFYCFGDSTLELTSMLSPNATRVLSLH